MSEEKNMVSSENIEKKSFEVEGGEYDASQIQILEGLEAVR